MKKKMSMFKKLLMACLFLMHSLAFAGGDLMIHVDDIGNGRVVVWRNEEISIAPYQRRIELRQLLQELNTYISANETLTAQSIVDFFKQEGYNLDIVNENHPDYLLSPHNGDKGRIMLWIGGGLLGSGVVTGVLVMAGTISTSGALPLFLITGGLSVMSIAAPLVDRYKLWSGPDIESVIDAVDEALAGQRDVDWELFVEQ